MPAPLAETIHATSVAIHGQGVLIMGPSGSGKSDLALRLIDRGATLISDDYTRVCARDGALRLATVPALAGIMEIRHLGLVEMPHVDDVSAVLAIRLEETPPRMPEAFATILLAGLALPVVALAGREPSAPLKVEMALRHLPRLLASS